ncbi:MAG: sigma-54-dependent Fis family transcriptional regulator, partial [Mangrovicoccus sp.]
QRAARLMARALGQDWRQSGAVTGKHISDIFQLDLPMMEGLTRQIPASDRLIETQDGYRLFAHAIEPRKTAPTPIRRSPSLPPALRDLAGDDPAMGQVLTTAAMLAKGRRAFLVTGETGCGKSTLIQAIHDSGSKGPAITLACESFDEDEAAAIFGREDRRQFQPGQIARAEGGLLVLDNIDELPLKFQARLVMLLTEGRYRPVGAMRERQAILRLVASISGDPAEAVAQGQLRRDLYLRLSGTHLHVPPLRARQDRLWVMERVFATAFGGKIGFEPSAIAALAGHDWPGNFHELQQIAEDAAARRAGSRARPLQASELSLPNMAEPGSALDAERATLAHHLSATDWNITQTAQILGVNRATIYRRITRFNLARD